MTFDILVKGGTLPDGRTVDVAIADRRTAAVEAPIDAEAGEVVDATGRLVSSPFVDPHFHMDATLSHGTPRIGWLLPGRECPGLVLGAIRDGPVDLWTSPSGRPTPFRDVWTSRGRRQGVAHRVAHTRGPLAHRSTGQQQQPLFYGF